MCKIVVNKKTEVGKGMWINNEVNNLRQKKNYLRQKKMTAANTVPAGFLRINFISHYFLAI